MGPSYQNILTPIPPPPPPGDSNVRPRLQTAGFLEASSLQTQLKRKKFLALSFKLALRSLKIWRRE